MESEPMLTPKEKSPLLEMLHQAGLVCLLVGCLTSQQQASVSQGRICSDNFYVLPHWDRSCRSNVLPHPVTVYWHQANQSQCWPYNARRLAGKPLECQCLSDWYDSTPKNSWRKRDSNPGPSALEADALTTRPTRRFKQDSEPNTWPTNYSRPRESLIPDI